MPSNILVQVPDTLREHHTHLKDFFECMIHKLHKNAHKDPHFKPDLPRLMDKLIEEIVEFEQQVAQDKFSPNSLMELADQANFAYLAYKVLRDEGVKHEGEVKGDNPQSA